MEKPPICLNMIVKNETPVLGRLINSVKNFIDYYVIVDTGSHDGTPEFIKTTMDTYHIPGEVIIEDWINFGVNRDLALRHACARRQKGWLLLIDADEEFCTTEPLFYQQLTPGTTYCLRKHHGSTRYALANLIDISQNRWQWQGVVHEYLMHLEGSNTRETLENTWIHYHAGEGVRSRGLTAEQKFLGDAALLEAELQKNPDDPRNQFYLAQSYRDAGHLELAYEHYLKRASLQGWVEETFVALFQAGNIAESLKKAYAEIVDIYLKAFEILPIRSESLHALARYCRNQKQYNLAYLFASQGLDIPYPTQSLFVNTDVYHWQLLDELAVSAYWSGHYQESKAACIEIMQRQAKGLFKLSEENHQRIIDNLNFAITKI